MFAPEGYSPMATAIRQFTAVMKDEVFKFIFSRIQEDQGENLNNMIYLKADLVMTMIQEDIGDGVICYHPEWGKLSVDFDHLVSIDYHSSFLIDEFYRNEEDEEPFFQQILQCFQVAPMWEPSPENCTFDNWFLEPGMYFSPLFVNRYYSIDLSLYDYLFGSYRSYPSAKAEEAYHVYKAISGGQLCVSNELLENVSSRLKILDGSPRSTVSVSEIMKIGGRPRIQEKAREAYKELFPQGHLGTWKEALRSLEDEKEIVVSVDTLRRSLGFKK